MRFIVDECTGPAVASWLKDHGHEVFSVYDEARGMSDKGVIQKARDEESHSHHQRQGFRLDKISYVDLRLNHLQITDGLS